MPLVTANQFQLQPNTGLAAQQGLQLGQQFRQIQQQKLGNQQAQQIQDLSSKAATGDPQALTQLSGIDPEAAKKIQTFIATQQENRFKSVVRGAQEVQSIPTVEGKIAFLENRIASDLPSQGVTNTSDTQELLDLYKSGDIEGGNALVGQAIQSGVQSGFLKASEASKVKPTSSQQDFKTFKQLNERALKTQDPIDIQLAEQFGRQSGFDRETPQELADIEVKKESGKALVRQAATASKEAFDSLKGVRLTIANIGDAVKALDNGAETGPIISKLPSFRQASIELDNVRGRMGLDVVGATTFGALSESELAFALNVALPDNLEPKALKAWLIRKKDTQTKLANELRKAASFLGTPGNTIADFIAKQEKEAAKTQDDEAKILAKYGL
jgi:hypothetical protein